MQDVEPLSVEGRIKIPYRWPAGRLGTRFLAALRDEKVILGAVCPSCEIPHVPPRPICSACGEPLARWVPVGPRGVVEAWTRRGDTLYAAVRLDGAGTAMVHRLIDVAPSSIRPFQRVEAVFADQRRGSILDISGFRPIAESEPPTDTCLREFEEARTRWETRTFPTVRTPRLRPVAILGVAQTVHTARREDRNYAELAFEAVRAVLARSNLAHDRVDTVVTASSDFWDGRTISDMAVQDAAGAAGKSASKVSMDGVFALAYAAARVNSGAYNTCLVVAHGKASEGDPRIISTAAFDPVYERPLGIDDHAALGLHACEWTWDDRHGDRVSTAELAQAAADAWNKSSRNPYAHRRSTRTAAQVLESPGAADPLHADMIAPDSDGACAVLIADEETGKRLGATVWLEGFACATHLYPFGRGGLAALTRLRGLAGNAVDGAGMPRHTLGPPNLRHMASPDDVERSTRELAGLAPRQGAIDVAEVHDASAMQTILWRRALGLGHGGGCNESNGVLFNESGGAMGAQPGFATGLVRVAEVYERLARGEGEVGLAHGQTGFVGQAHGIWILRRR